MKWLAETVTFEAEPFVRGRAVNLEDGFLRQMEDLQDACLRAAKVCDVEDINPELAAWDLPTSAEGLRNMVLHQDENVLRDLHLEITALKDQLAEKKRVEDWKKRGDVVKSLLG
ncbi:unnamed protein product [Auanema sp. JU1783]|nr:unnamed protein product [Auanema sp. JU1783]